MKKYLILFCAVLCALALAACGGETHSEVEGRYLQTADGTALIVTEDGSPIVMSDQSEGSGLFDGLDTGDRIRITYDGINDSYPGQTGAYSCEKMADGSPADLPEETLTRLEELGYVFHAHAPTEEPKTVADPISGYCGNTVTEITLDGETYSFWGSDSVALTDILINLAYDPDHICRCPTAFTVDTEFGDGYGVNLTESFARCEAGQAALTAEQAETIQGILERNCGAVTVTQACPGEEPEVRAVTGGTAADLAGLLASLNYIEPLCKCLPEYTVETAAGSYGVKLSTEQYARFEGGQVSLTAEQAEALRALLGAN